MRKYYWDKKELLREFNMLKKLLNNSSVSDDEKKKIQTKLIMLLDMNECSKVLKRCIRNLRIFNYDEFFDIDSELKEMKKNSTIPIITKVPKHINNSLLSLDIQATKAYSILNPKVNPLSDYFISPIIKKY